MTEAVVDVPSRHDPVSEMVTTPPLADCVAVVQVPPKPPLKFTLGDVGRVKPDGKVTAMVSPAASCPAPEDVKPTVQLATAVAVAGEPTYVTPVTAPPEPVMISPDDGLTALVASSDVFTEKPDAK